MIWIGILIGVAVVVSLIAICTCCDVRPKKLPHKDIVGIDVEDGYRFSLAIEDGNNACRYAVGAADLLKVRRKDSDRMDQIVLLILKRYYDETMSCLVEPLESAIDCMERGRKDDNYPYYLTQHSDFFVDLSGRPCVEINAWETSDDPKPHCFTCSILPKEDWFSLGLHFVFEGKKDGMKEDKVYFKGEIDKAEIAHMIKVTAKRILPKVNKKNEVEEETKLAEEYEKQST